MKKNLFMGFALALSMNSTQAHVPYYMQNPDYSKANAIKINQACDDCGDCSNNAVTNPFEKQKFTDLRTACAKKAAAAMIIITEAK